jgi:amidohydrolase
VTAKLSALDAAWEIGPEVVANRRYLHQHPELSFHEEQTSRFVAEKLRDLGVETHTGIANTGVLGILRGARPGKTVLLRADMDALPIEELNDVPYKSDAPGVMHACGHDAHRHAARRGALAEPTHRRVRRHREVRLSASGRSAAGWRKVDD